MKFNPLESLGEALLSSSTLSNPIICSHNLNKFGWEVGSFATSNNGLKTSKFRKFWDSIIINLYQLESKKKKEFLLFKRSSKFWTNPLFL